MPTQRKLRKREIVFAVLMGALGAGGVAAVLSDDASPRTPPAVVAGPDNLTYDVAEFQEISTEGPQEVEIEFGDTHSVRSDGSPEAIAQLEVVVEDGVLRIRPKDRSRPGFDWSTFDSTTVHVVLPRLERIAMAGSGDIHVDRIRSDSFSSTIAGSGELSIGNLEVDEADFSINGSGNVTAAGTARETRVTIAGTGEVAAGGLHSKTASVSIGGYGEVALTVDDDARVSIGGAGEVDIAGTAHCSVTRMGGGEVRCNGRDIE